MQRKDVARDLISKEIRSAVKPADIARRDIFHSEVIYTELSLILLFLAFLTKYILVIYQLCLLLFQMPVLRASVH